MRTVSPVVDDADPWSLTQPHKSKIDYAADEPYQPFFAATPNEIGHMFAAQSCHDEVCNGGFHQFFTNSTGWLAPEALAAFKAMKLKSAAQLLEKAMAFFGNKYPRDAETREAKLSAVPGEKRRQWDPFYLLDEKYFEQTAAYANASKAYAKVYVQKRDAGMRSR